MMKIRARREPISKRIKDGNGELLGFVFVLPFIVTFIITILAASQISEAKQELTYAAYSVGRTVAVSSSMENANARASVICNEILGEDALYEIEIMDAELGWQKGNYVKVTVSKQVNTLMPFTSGVRSRDIVMMIENQ